MNCKDEASNASSPLCTPSLLVQDGEDALDAISLQVIFRKRAL